MDDWCLMFGTIEKMVATEQVEFVERLRPGLWLSMGDSVMEGEFGRDDDSGRCCVGAAMEVAVEMAPPSFYFAETTFSPDYIF
ncbi:unnamed protein product [Dovyalis caffra]|uniref:Uncharacterized protein n=1 Tax=Dovyalis caffra TaxID=77055 RepID=A0AAV1SWK5_9ROSI|nr:unnamed protein product [Dovyalis caffra]